MVGFASVKRFGICIKLHTSGQVIGYPDNYQIETLDWMFAYQYPKRVKQRTYLGFEVTSYITVIVISMAISYKILLCIVLLFHPLY